MVLVHATPSPTPPTPDTHSTTHSSSTPTPTTPDTHSTTHSTPTPPAPLAHTAPHVPAAPAPVASPLPPLPILPLLPLLPQLLPTHLAWTHHLPAHQSPLLTLTPPHTPHPHHLLPLLSLLLQLPIFLLLPLPQLLLPLLLLLLLPPPAPSAPTAPHTPGMDPVLINTLVTDEDLNRMYGTWSSDKDQDLVAVFGDVQLDANERSVLIKRPEFATFENIFHKKLQEEMNVCLTKV